MPKKKVSKGQINLLGEVLGYELRYKPHKVVKSTGEAVVVLRIPEEADSLDRTASIEAMKRMAGAIKISPTRQFYLKKPRNYPR